MSSLDISFLDNNKNDDTSANIPEAVSEFINQPESSGLSIPSDLADDFKRSFSRKKKKAHVSRITSSSNQPDVALQNQSKQEPVPGGSLLGSPTELKLPVDTVQVEQLRSVLSMYLNFWPEKFPNYSHKMITEMEYAQLIETRLVFDSVLASGQNAQSVINIFYQVIQIFETACCSYGVNIKGYADCCHKTKEIDDDIKYLAIQLVARNNMPPHLRLGINMLKTFGMVYKYHKLESSSGGNMEHNPSEPQADK